MVQIVITRQSPAETGGGVWRAGGTYTASDSYAKVLIGRGDAYALDGSIVDIDDSTGSGGYLGGGGGDDPTAWGSFTGTKPGTVTVNGVTWTIGYTGDNVTSYTVALTGDDLVVNVSYDNGYPEYSGNIIKGGAVVMTATQLRYLRDEVLIPAGVAAAGFRARNDPALGANDTDCIAYLIDTAGTKSYRSSVWEWDGAMLVPQEGASRSTYQTVSPALSASESAALWSITFPGWLVKPGNTLACETAMTATGGASGTLTARLKLAGDEFANGVGGAGGSPASIIRGDVRALGSASQIMGTPVFGQTGGHGASSVAAITGSVNSETTDFVITATSQTVVDKTVTARYLRVFLERT